MLHGVIWQDRVGQRIRAALEHGEPIRCELARFARKFEDADENLKRVKKVYSETYTLVSLEENIASIYSSVRYQVLNDQIKEFKVRLPKNVIVHEIIGDDMEGWSELETSKGITTYLVKVLYPVTDSYDLSVRYEVPITNKEFSIPNLEISGVARDIGYIGIEMKSHAELMLKKLDKARLMDVQELHEIIKSDASSPIVYALRYMGHPFKAQFSVITHDNYEMDAAIADKVEYIYVVSPKGTTIAQSRMTIRNSQKQFISFVLPQEAKVMSVFLDGNSVKPSIGDKGEILLPLKRQSIEPFIVEAVFEVQNLHINKIGGYINVMYPVIDIPVSILKTKIYIPEDLHYSGLFGDLKQEEIQGFVTWNESYVSKRKIAISEPRSMDSKEEGVAGIMPAAPIEILAKPTGQLMVQEELQQVVSDTDLGGTLPLKITLPVKGNLISASAFYTQPGTSLKTMFIFCNKFIYYIAYGLGVLIFVLIGFFGLNFIKPNNRYFWIKIAGIIMLFYLIPFSWQIILICLVIGFIIYNMWAWIRLKRA